MCVVISAAARASRGGRVHRVAVSSCCGSGVHRVVVTGRWICNGEYNVRVNGASVPREMWRFVVNRLEQRIGVLTARVPGHRVVGH